MSRTRLLGIFGILAVVFAMATPAFAQVNVDQALQPVTDLLKQLFGWLIGPGRLIIALAWLVVGLKVVLGMEHRGAGAFIFVAVVGLLIIFTPQILGAIGIDLSRYITATQ